MPVQKTLKNHSDIPTNVKKRSGIQQSLPYSTILEVYFTQNAGRSVN
jgi:hypothetical protein